MKQSTLEWTDPLISIKLHTENLKRIGSTHSLPVICSAMLDLMGVKHPEELNVNFDDSGFLNKAIITSLDDKEFRHHVTLPHRCPDIESFCMCIAHIKVHKQCRVHFESMLEFEYSGIVHEWLTVSHGKPIKGIWNS